MTVTTPGMFSLAEAQVSWKAPLFMTFFSLTVFFGFGILAGFWILDSGFLILDMIFWILDFGFGIVDFVFDFLDSEFWILDF